ncbi:MAG: hypothetical protein AB7W59_00410 [Acidimicrobiia bacterium]
MSGLPKTMGLEIVAQPGRTLSIRFQAMKVHGVRYSGSLHTKDYGDGKQVPVRNEHGHDHHALYASRCDGRWPSDPTPAGKRGLRQELCRLLQQAFGRMGGLAYQRALAIVVERSEEAWDAVRQVADPESEGGVVDR